MPSTPPLRPSGSGPGPLGRRRVLLGLSALTLGVGVLPGCTSSPGPTPPPSPGGPADPDAALRAEVAAAEEALSRKYTAAAAAQPSLTRALGVGARHASYAAAVLPAASQSPTGSTAPGTRPTTSPTAAPPTGSGGAAGVLTGLAGAERAAAKERIAQCVRASDPDLARVLALVGAGCAAAAQLLKEPGRG